MTTLPQEAYAVIEGRHSDPFHYLGFHVEGDAPVVRAFLPDAEEVVERKLVSFDEIVAAAWERARHIDGLVHDVRLTSLVPAPVLGDRTRLEQPARIAEVELQHARGDVLQEIAVVADHDAGE